MTILRDPYSQGRYGKIWFTLSARFGFGVVDATAIRYMLHPTA
jgi:predicted phage gp36 major capsid-like protein